MCGGGGGGGGGGGIPLYESPDLSCPQLRDGVVVDAVEHGLQGLGHHHLTLERLQQVLERGMDYREEAVVADHLCTKQYTRVT